MVRQEYKVLKDQPEHKAIKEILDRKDLAVDQADPKGQSDHKDLLVL
jgi:hypothetical protein